MEGWDLFLTANYRTVYWLTGVLGPAETPTVCLLSRDGKIAVVSAGPEVEGIDQFIPLETYSIARTITDVAGDAARHLCAVLGGFQNVSRYAVEQGSFPLVFSELLQEAFPRAERCHAHAAILDLRKRKEADEVAEIRRSLRLCFVAYDAAKKTIAPGLTEIDVHNAMYDAVVREAGTTVVFNGDFACGERGIRGGGPPTTRKIEEGDLYILDLFPAPALYFGDTCRAFCSGTPTDLQLRAWETVRQAVTMAESAIKPGVRARDIYQLVKEYLDSFEWAEKSFWHHAGHGIGHHGHEAPRIIPGSDDIFEVGDVFTLEPGVYTQALRGGIRLEDNYLLTENGLENLFDFPMTLT